MSNFSEQLKIAIDAAGLTQAELSNLTGFPQSSISRYLKAEFAPSVEFLGKVLDVLPDNLHYELILARLTDELPSKYRDSVTILAHGGAVAESAAPYRPLAMAEDLRRAVEYLANEAIQQPAVRDLLIGLARALGLRK